MLHLLAAAAVTGTAYSAGTHKPAARPAPGSHAWIIRWHTTRWLPVRRGGARRSGRHCCAPAQEA